MLDKVAINKEEIETLIESQEYDLAIEQIEHVKDIMELITKDRVNKMIKEGIIFEQERRAFSKLIKDNINNKILEDPEYVLMSEEDIRKIRNS